MTPRILKLTERAIADIDRRAEYLAHQRGAEFARVWIDALIDWLDRIAEGGVQIGTQHPTEKAFRTFGYKRQATVLAEFQSGEVHVIRIYFSGQDWAS